MGFCMDVVLFGSGTERSDTMGIGKSPWLGPVLSKGINRFCLGLVSNCSSKVIALSNEKQTDLSGEILEIGKFAENLWIYHPITPIFLDSESATQLRPPARYSAELLGAAEDTTPKSLKLLS